MGLRIRASAPVGAFVAIVSVGILLPGAVGAKTFEPTRFDDPVPDLCKPKNCSLREAVRAANDRPGKDSIVLRKGTYELGPIVPGGGGAIATFGDPLSIRGKSARSTRIDGNYEDRVILAASSLSLRDLAVVRGDPATLGRKAGGGIVASGPKLTLNEVVVSKNRAVYGGGIETGAGLTRINKTTVTGNQATEGGGLNAVGNSLLAEAPRTLIRASTFDSNFAVKGGGILADGNQPDSSLDPHELEIVNSTVARNNTFGSGGGILADNEASVVLDHATVAYNGADTDATGGGAGGGIHQNAGALFEFDNSLVAGNSVGSSGAGAQCQGAFLADASVVQTQSSGSCAMVGSQVIVADAMIGDLEDNDGPTETVELLSGSPALKAADPCPPPKIDQRGVTRPKNCDAGAYERKGS